MRNEENVVIDRIQFSQLFQLNSQILTEHLFLWLAVLGTMRIKRLPITVPDLKGKKDIKVKSSEALVTFEKRCGNCSQGVLLFIPARLLWGQEWNMR